MLSSLLAKLEDLRNGREADFGGKGIDSEDLRNFLLQLDPGGGKSPRCFIRNAEFRNKVDLSDGREPGGGALPALEFHSCTFHRGFCADGARMERLKFHCCNFVAKESISNIPFPEREPCAGYSAPASSGARLPRELRRPANCISLRHCRVETELRLEFLSPVDCDGAPGVLTVDAFAIRVGTNVHVSDTTLRAQHGESSDLSDEPHYALHLATASIGGDVQLMPNLVIEGGLKMRDAQVGGSVWGMGLRVTDGEERSPNELIRQGCSPRRALWLDTTEILGNLILIESEGRSLRVEGAISLLNSAITGDAYIQGDIRDSVLMQGATVKGRLGIWGKARAVGAQQITIDGDCTFACSGMRLLGLNGASIRGTLDVGGSTFTGPYLPDVRAVAGSAELVCYPGMRVVEVLCTTSAYQFPDDLLIATFLVSEDEGRAPLLLDGSSRRLHDLNRQLLLQLETAEQAREYLKLFCASVWADLGAFTIIDNRHELPAGMKDLDPAVRIEAKRNLWEAKAYVRYGDLLSLATMNVEKSGHVRMVDQATLGRYDNASDKARLTKFERPYRIPTRNLAEYWSDFMGAQPTFVALKPGSDEERYWTWALMLSASEGWEARRHPTHRYPDADLRGASCKLLNDWRLWTPEGIERRKYSWVLTWPKRRTWLEEFDYQQLVFDRQKDFKRRLRWVRGAPAVPELYGWFAFSQFAGSVVCLGFLVAAAVALAWVWTLYSGHPTGESSGHFGWRFLAVLAVLSCAGLLGASRIRHMRGGRVLRFFRDVRINFLRLLLGLARLLDQQTESEKRKEFFRNKLIRPLRLLIRRARLGGTPVGRFDAQPYAHLAKVLRDRGDDLAARDVEAEKMWREAVERGETDYWQWLAKHIWWRPYGVMFRFGLSPQRAFISLLCFWCLGWAATYLLSNNGMLRTSIMRVAPTVLIEEGAPMKPALERDRAVVTADLSCEEEIEPALYAFELMMPIVNLHQEGRCDLRSKPKDQVGARTPKIRILPGIRLPVLFSYGWFWEYAKAVYMLLGSVVTSLALLTVSGIARRWEH